MITCLVGRILHFAIRNTKITMLLIFWHPSLYSKHLCWKQLLMLVCHLYLCASAEYDHVLSYALKTSMDEPSLSSVIHSFFWKHLCMFTHMLCLCVQTVYDCRNFPGKKCYIMNMHEHILPHIKCHQFRQSTNRDWPSHRLGLRSSQIISILKMGVSELFAEQKGSSSHKWWHSDKSNVGVCCGKQRKFCRSTDVHGSNGLSCQIRQLQRELLESNI